MILKGGVTLGQPGCPGGSEGPSGGMPCLEDRRPASGVRCGCELRRRP